MKKVKEIRRRSKIDKKIEEEKEKEEEEVEGALGEPELVWKDKQLFGCVEI